MYRLKFPKVINRNLCLLSQLCQRRWAILLFRFLLLPLEPKIRLHLPLKHKLQKNKQINSVWLQKKLFTMHFKSSENLSRRIVAITLLFKTRTPKDQMMWLEVRIFKSKLMMTFSKITPLTGPNSDSKWLTEKIRKIQTQAVLFLIHKFRPFRRNSNSLMKLWNTERIKEGNLIL